MPAPTMKPEWVRGALGATDLVEMAGRQGKPRYMGIACSCGARLCQLFFEASTKELGAHCTRCGKEKRFVIGEPAGVS
jgi:hypothetical protein